MVRGWTEKEEWIVEVVDKFVPGDKFALVDRKALTIARIIYNRESSARRP